MVQSGNQPSAPSGEKPRRPYSGRATQSIKKSHDNPVSISKDHGYALGDENSLRMDGVDGSMISNYSTADN